MRILTFSSLFPNARRPAHGIFVYRRASNLAQIPGMKVEAVAPVPWEPKWMPPKWSQFAGVPRREKIGSLQVYHPRYPLIPKVSMPFHGLLMFLGARKEAQRLHREEPFDCIDAHYVYPDGFAAVLLGKKLGIPVIVWGLGTDINLFPSFPTIRRLIRWTLRHSSGIVAVSAPLKQRMVELGVSEGKIQIIGNGVDAELFHIMDRKQARRTLGISEEGGMLVSVAALREGKGQQHIIAALARIANRHPDLKLYLVGEGDNRSALETLVHQYSLQNQVFLVGPKGSDEIPLWFNAADASILASSREGWPNVILESLACGTPVVATPVGQIPEILASKELGIIANQDTDSLAAAIDSAISRIWDRTSMSRFAHGRPWSTVAKEIKHFLSTVVTPSSPARVKPFMTPN